MSIGIPLSLSRPRFPHARPLAAVLLLAVLGVSVAGAVLARGDIRPVATRAVVRTIRWDPRVTPGHASGAAGAPIGAKTDGPEC